MTFDISILGLGDEELLMKGVLLTDETRRKCRKVFTNLSKLACWAHLSSERCELCESRLFWLVKLTFPDHVSNFDSGKGRRR